MIVDDEVRRQGHPHRVRRAAWAAPRWDAASAIAEGRVPLHTLRADIEFGRAEAKHDLRRDRREVLDLQG